MASMRVGRPFGRLLAAGRAAATGAAGAGERVSSELELGALAERVRELAARRLQGYELEAVPRPWGRSVYLRWESRGVKRALELQVAEFEPLGIDVWATASK